MSKILDALTLIAPSVANIIREKYGKKDPTKYDILILMLGVTIEQSKEVAQILNNHITHEEKVMKEILRLMRLIFDSPSE